MPSHKVRWARGCISASTGLPVPGGAPDGSTQNPWAVRCGPGGLGGVLSPSCASPPPPSTPHSVCPASPKSNFHEEERIELEVSQRHGLRETRTSCSTRMLAVPVKARFSPQGSEDPGGKPSPQATAPLSLLDQAPPPGPATGPRPRCPSQSLWAALHLVESKPFFTYVVT